MVKRETKTLRLYLDKVERRKIAEIKALKPEYSDLELYQVAHMELKERLFEEVRGLKSPLLWSETSNLAQVSA